MQKNLPFTEIEVDKSAIGYRVEDASMWGGVQGRIPSQRGLNVYNYHSLIGQVARDVSGNIISTEYQLPYFSLTVSERIDIARCCAPVFAVITGRMNIISGLTWRVTHKNKREDEIAIKLRIAKQVMEERISVGQPKDLNEYRLFQENRVIVNRCAQFIKSHLVDILPDMSNFDRSLLRWSASIKASHEDVATSIEDWLSIPNDKDNFSNFIKKIVFDTHVHGNAVIYKQRRDGVVGQLFTLAGGSCYPIQDRTVGGANGIVQIIDGAEAQVYFKDEANIIHYTPYSGDPYGLVPLECLTNKVAEILMFDHRAAMMADGTKPADVLLAFGDKTPWGGLQGEFDIPLPKDEQKRLETVVNEHRKEAVRIISGHGTPIAVDINRSDIFQYQSERQRMVREEVGLVFGASNAEMNLTGSESTSGRNSSEQQENKDVYKGIAPHTKGIEDYFNQQILDFRNPGYCFQFDQKMSESDQLKYWTDMLNSGLYSVNEIRRDEMGKDGFSGEEFNQPRGVVPPQQQFNEEM